MGKAEWAWRGSKISIWWQRLPTAQASSPQPQETPRVGVGVLIRKGNQVLLLRRKNVHGEGTWSTPGGHLEFGETPEACAAREAKEETGVDVSEVRFLGITNDYFEAHRKHFITLWMEARYAGGEPAVTAPYESDRVGWFGWEDLPGPLFPPFEQLLKTSRPQRQDSLSPSSPAPRPRR